jgi:hypothetical protein
VGRFALIRIIIQSLFIEVLVSIPEMHEVNVHIYICAKDIDFASDSLNVPLIG